jgi:hypothetical protein
MEHGLSTLAVSDRKWRASVAIDQRAAIIKSSVFITASNDE